MKKQKIQTPKPTNDPTPLLRVFPAKKVVMIEPPSPLRQQFLEFSSDPLHPKVSRIVDTNDAAHWFSTTTQHLDIYRGWDIIGLFIYPPAYQEFIERHTAPWAAQCDIQSHSYAPYEKASFEDLRVTMLINAEQLMSDKRGAVLADWWHRTGLKFHPSSLLEDIKWQEFEDYRISSDDIMKCGHLDLELAKALKPDMPCLLFQ